MLADSPTDLRLWDAFARINVCQGLVKTACDVYAKTLQQPHLASQESACFLWASWAELEWRSGNLDRAALILAASTALPGSRESLLSSNTQLKPAQILATRSRFVEATATMKEFPPQWYTHTIIVSAALFEYLMRGLSAACHIFEECCYDAKPLPAFREVLTMSHAKLLYQHTKQQAYQPGLIREVVAEALEQFPANSYLLNLYFFNESKTRIQNRLRSMLDNQVFTSGSTKEAPSNIWLYRIFAETHLDARGFNIRAVQHLFEASVQALQTRPSTSLWQLYLHFASRYCERATVQSVSSRALQECPTIKGEPAFPSSMASKVLITLRQSFTCTVSEIQLEQLFVEMTLPRYMIPCATSNYGWSSRLSHIWPSTNSISTSPTMPPRTARSTTPFLI